MTTGFETTFYGGLAGGADWQIISVAAASISVIVASMLIMVARLFDLRNFEQIAKTEFVYAASTVLIVVMVVAMIQFAERPLANGDDSLARCLYLSGFGCPCDAPATFPQETLIDWMKLYMDTPTKCVQTFMIILYNLSIPIEAIASIFMEIYMSEHASGFGVKWIAERITNTTQSLSFYMYMYYLLGYVLDFIKYYAGFFFSIGVALRAFPPTRGAGAYLMAAAVGFYFVFPLSYILIASMSLPHAQSEILLIEDRDAEDNPLCITDEEGSFRYTCMLPEVTNMTAYSCGGASLARASEFPNIIRSNADALQDMLSFRLNDFTRHLISAICIFPVISLIILLTFVLNVSNLFGGNIPEIGRGLVKLI